MGLKDIPPSDSNAILFRYKPYFTTKSNIGYSGLSSEHESSNFCQSPAPRRSTIHKFSLPRFLAIHLTRQSPFYGPPRHIRSRDGINLCPSRDPNPSRQHSKAHPLARWFAGSSPPCHTRPYRASVPLSCNSSGTAIAILRASSAHPLARWFAGRSIPSQNLRSRIRGVLQKSQALHLIKIRAGVCASHYALEGLRTLMFRIILH